MLAAHRNQHRGTTVIQLAVITAIAARDRVADQFAAHPGRRSTVRTPFKRR